MDAGKFRRSFRYAYEGIKYALATQQNMKFHFLVAVLVLVLALAMELTKTDILFLLLAVTLVIVTELINTAVEKAVDLAMPDQHPVAKIAKDVAAASVLVSAVFAVVTGMIVFFSPLDRLLVNLRAKGPLTAAGVWLVLALVMLIVIAVQTRFSRNRVSMRPSLLSAVASAVFTLVSILGSQTLIVLLCAGLAVLVLFVLYEKKSRSAASLLAGSVLGGGIVLLVFAMFHSG
ncbi:diacylglycerol kinase [Paenibacillus sp. y28]|uniref:diacylglycerol kinase n=1 Tax=Paenibacillus sp. y28 TaxID=3129110 RepID=UPI0030197C3C